MAGLVDAIHHIFLPPKLPQQEDAAPLDSLILKIATDALAAFQDLENSDASFATHLLSRLRSLHGENGIHESSLRSTLCNLRDGDTIALHVRAQNAAVLITRLQDKLVFEAFELAPKNEAVFSKPGRLVRTFPEIAVSVDASKLQRPDFASTIANTISTMSQQEVDEMQPQSKKAGRMHEEDRDTTDSAIVSGLLFGILRGIGSAHAATTVSKNTREEVLWKNARRPWRRSPFWMLIRATLHLTMSRSDDHSDLRYKKLMVLTLSEVLDLALQMDLPSELYYVMNAKIERRRQKLAHRYSFDDKTGARIADTLKRSTSKLALRWQSIRDRDSRTLDLEALKGLNFRKDCDVAIPQLESHLQTIRSRQVTSSSVSFEPSSGLVQHAAVGSLPSLPSDVADDYAAANLQQFERWVARNLSVWVDATDPKTACDSLSRLLKDYHAMARKLYSNNPEGISVMLLTIYEIWVGCDRAAVRDCAMLAQYSSGIPCAVLQNLLLPHREQMERLTDIEQYLSGRNAGIDSSKLFDMGKDAFGCRYFDTSIDHQNLMQSIESDAQTKRQSKLDELQRQKNEYRRLDALYSRAECEYETKIIDDWCDPPETEQVHKSSCAKCKYRRDRDSLKVTIHEWPIPEDPFEAKTIVFELDVPTCFARWRDARSYLLYDVLQGKFFKASLRAFYKLSSNDPHVAKLCRTTQHRIGLVSEAKPFAVTHYREKNISGATEQSVCVRNGLQYQYYDSNTGNFVEMPNFDDSVPLECTYTLPQKASALQKFLFRPSSSPDGPPPNVVIASQEICPDSMSLEEYKELSTIPLGHHIQWANIALQLAMPSVDFKKPETTLAILQCIYQAGPPAFSGDVLREAHAIFHDDAKAASLLNNLQHALLRVKENWESAQALQTFIAIATRALSLNNSVRDTCLSFLESARAIAHGWSQLLRDKAHRAADHTTRTEFLSKSVEVALICASAFDLEDRHLQLVLRSAEQTSLLLRAAIVVHEGEHTRVTHGRRIALLDLRLKRLLNRATPLLIQSQNALDRAIKLTWSGFNPNEAGWSQASSKADHWMTSMTAADSTDHHIRVDYNLLTGDLLANGLPLDQPPTHYRKQPLYEILFGKAVVEVMPAADPGFEFSAKRLFGEGCEVQLGMVNNELIVRSNNSEGVWETVPNRVIQGIFPAHFCEDFVLWYNAASTEVEFRPRDDPWNQSSHQICILSRSESHSWTLVKDGKLIVGLSSITSTALAEIFGSLAPAEYIHLLVDQAERQMSIEVPTLRLGFSLSEGGTELKSHEYRGKIVDKIQRLETLIGFTNKLLLKSKNGDNRMAIILESDLSYDKRDGHVVAKVNDSAHAKVHALKVDTLLCRLQDSGLDCKLYLTYLHAITSFCLPDPFTQRTGTEQALAMLTSKAVRSFDQLSQENLDVLGRIGNLSPGRCFYPAHKREMQQVTWDGNLSFLSQHGHFSEMVSSLFDQARTVQMFFPMAQPEIPRLKEIQQCLRMRDNTRSSSFRVSGFGAEDFNPELDSPYNPKDRHFATRAQNAAYISNFLSRDGNRLHYAVPAHDAIWRLMRTETSLPINGASVPVDPSRLRYDAELLESGFEQAIVKFPALHHWSKTRQNTLSREFLITVWLSTLAFAKEADMEAIQAIAVLFKSSELAGIDAPQATSFRPRESPSDGSTIQEREITRIISQRKRPFERSPEHSWSRRPNEKRKAYDSRRIDAWKSNYLTAVQQVSRSLEAQWQCRVPVHPAVDNASTYINMSQAMSEIKAKFETWYDNSLLYEYLINIQEAMLRFDCEPIRLPSLGVLSPKIAGPMPRFVAENDLFSESAPVLAMNGNSLRIDSKSGRRKGAQTASEPLLASFLRKLQAQQGQQGAGQSTYVKAHLGDLDESLHALMLRNDAKFVPDIHFTQATLDTHLAQCQVDVEIMYRDIITSMRAAAGINREGQQFPRVCPLFILKRLARDHWDKLSDDWKKCVTDYGLALTALQRAQRLVRLGAGFRKEDLISELSNPGHTNWSPMDHPESLLIEVESDIMIRDVQEQIAQEMRQPSVGSNAVCQLNMGEGKSSVIVPVVAAGLANGSQLVRVVVGKPQSKQMAQMLISKMGGLVGRQVYYMPFSRSLKVDSQGAEAISNMLHECMRSGGILLVQPEHILSFKLMAPECYISGKPEVGNPLMSTQDFLDRCSRDIVDESDENFSTRFELIYTMGMQRSIEMSPDRWFLVQQVLDVVRKLAPAIAKELPQSIELGTSIAGAFAKARLLRQDAESLLISRLARHICQQGLQGFHLGRQPSHVRDAVYTYLSKLDLATSDIDAVENSTLWTESVQLQLLMLRGLLAGGVLSFTLGHKRWRVNYGLADRAPPTKLAVPYRAKDSPTPRSEFSHPDVVITLTSLCYYYEGLSDEDLFTAFGHLMDSDQADIEYQAWVKDSCNLPSSFGQLQGINLKDKPQCIDDLFPSLKFGKSVIDYFLSRIVFPKEMKEFPHKLSASGWDLGKSRPTLTTGFSGTIDSRHLLPLGIKHVDLPHQKHTNALVLDYLLQPQNGVQLMSSANSQTGHVSDAEDLLSAVLRLDPAVQVILDVGAQILELTNVEMAQTWLKRHDNTKQAVVFVNDDDEICVVDRQGRIDPLRTSSYQSRLDSCLVFLDEAHTRGIDIRLPADYRAAVTLGANLTKDRLVQACMRLRKLGKGQTVVFCISEEIQAKILEATAKKSAQDIVVADVLEWAISETHSDIRHNIPPWSVQGERFVRQEKILKSAQDQNGNTTMTGDKAKAFLEDEAQTIDARYRPRRSCGLPSFLSDTTDPDLQQIASRCQAFDDVQFDARTLQEEQERELSPEIEQERQVQKAPPAEPLQHQLHDDVLKFAMTGKITMESAGYSPAFTSLRFTSAGKSFRPSSLASTQLLATMDFAQTVKHKGAAFVQDAFLRPVQWLLVRCTPDSNKVQHIMIISPYEANLLYQRMQKSTATTLHVYKPRINSGFSALAVDFYTIPALCRVPEVPPFLQVQLHVFSGALYFESHEQYKEVCKFLGISPTALTQEMELQGWKVDANGFILSVNPGRAGGSSSSLTQSPVPFIKALLSMRRNGDGVSKTHLGSLLEGKLFEEADFEKK